LVTLQSEERPEAVDSAALLQASLRELLAMRTARGTWEGRLSSSALSTATAIAALELFVRARPAEAAADRDRVRRGIDWLVDHQNADGGWGDTDRSLSNISTTALGWAALAFAEDCEPVSSAARRAESWLRAAAGGCEPPTLAKAIVARYGKDRTFSVPILTMCALAGRLGSDREAWPLIPQLPIELAVIPRRLFTVITLPVVSYALPALIAMGLARHRRRPSRNPLTRAIRDAAAARSLRVLTSLQPPNGGFLEATPLTSFVAMSLVAAGEPEHPVVKLALDFVRSSVREDGSWPIDTNLATWVTTMSVQALNAGGHVESYLGRDEREAIRASLLEQQTAHEHPYTGAAEGAWSWTNLPGGVPDADDTPGALLALHALGVDAGVTRAAARGVTWLLDLQNRDGGVPTFCRGWGALPFDRSGADLTAHTLRAWLGWRPHLDPTLQARVDVAVPRALAYLRHVQREDGAFVPLWFGNQHASGEENLTYGTARVLLALVTVRDGADSMIAPAVEWLLGAQNADGGWGGDVGTPSSIEETALAIGALASAASDERSRAAARRGGAWIANATNGGTFFPESPIGFYFAKLWYYERLYPIILVVDALERLNGSSKRPAPND
jgi:squalene-hopene/tetraprenyl-beta-curcumene cyclase